MITDSMAQAFSETAPRPRPRAVALLARWLISSRARWFHLAVLATSLFCATAAVCLHLLHTHPAELAVPWTGLVLLSVAAALALAGGLFHHITLWRRPVQRLEAALVAIRTGEAPLDELNQVGGRCTGAARQVREILHELKMQKALMQQTNHEMRRRIAQRTDAMERLISSLRLQASRDGLTGLYNRRAFDQHLAAFVEQTQAAGSDLCLLMLDIDHLKSLNDTLGHATGDEFLKSVGQIIRSTIREQDMAFRYGGDELTVVLPDASVEAGRALAQRLVSLIDALGRTYKIAQPPGLSAGLAMLSSLDRPTTAALLQQADKVLYSMKRARKRTRPAA